MRTFDKFKLVLKKKAFWETVGNMFFYYSIFVIFMFLFITSITFWLNQIFYFPELADKIKLMILLTVGWLMVLFIGLIKKLK